MGIEFLENAARAAGFAMAAEAWRAVPRQDEDFQDKMVDRAHASFSDWVKGVVGVNGRGAPA